MGSILLRMRSLRLFPYQSSTSVAEPPSKQSALLGIRWKPDISLLPSVECSAFKKYASGLNVDHVPPHLQRVIASIQLLCFKLPQARFLELESKEFRAFSALMTSFSLNDKNNGVFEYAEARIDDSGQLLGRYLFSDMTVLEDGEAEDSLSNDRFDIVVCQKVHCFTSESSIETLTVNFETARSTRPAGSEPQRGVGTCHLDIN